MLGFITRRLLSGALLLLVISSLAYLLMFSFTNNIAVHILGDAATPDQIVAKQHELGLDQPILTRYFDWLANALQGNLGVSWMSSESITDSLLSRLPVTLTLAGITILIAAILATVLGALAAVKGGWIDRLVQVIGIVGFAVPNFVVAIFFVALFAINLALLPATGWVAFEDDPTQWALSLVLPVGALVLGTVASSAQQIRSAIKNVLERDWVRTLKSRGIPTREILMNHVLRAAAPAGLTVLSLQFVGLLGGVVIIEQMFALPGMGYLAVASTTAGDTPVVMGVVVYTVILVILVNLIVDLLNGWLNPKVRVK